MSHTNTHSSTETSDVLFPIRGDAIPLDQGYSLYTALSRLPTTGHWLEGRDEAAIQPVRGRRHGNGLLDLTAKSKNDDTKARRTGSIPEPVPVV